MSTVLLPQQSMQIHQSVTTHMLVLMGHGTMRLDSERLSSLDDPLLEPAERPRQGGGVFLRWGALP
jgi:hypothetical protein